MHEIKLRDSAKRVAGSFKTFLTMKRGYFERHFSYYRLELFPSVKIYLQLKYLVSCAPLVFRLNYCAPNLIHFFLKDQFLIVV